MQQQVTGCFCFMPDYLKKKHLLIAFLSGSGLVSWLLKNNVARKILWQLPKAGMRKTLATIIKSSRLQGDPSAEPPGLTFLSLSNSPTGNYGLITRANTPPHTHTIGRWWAGDTAGGMGGYAFVRLAFLLLGYIHPKPAQVVKIFRNRQI